MKEQGDTHYSARSAMPEHRPARYWPEIACARLSAVVVGAPWAETVMQTKTETHEGMLRVAVRAMREGGRGLSQVLNELPAAIYVTNAEGVITHYNQTCISFAGRKPRVGIDSWCVTWNLYTEEGEYLPHDQCPMAVAVRERRAIRGARAMAERPDGRYVNFQPYPTPLFDDAGKLVAAINLLAEVPSLRQAHTLRAQAAKCRRLVNLWPDRKGVVISMAAEYDRKALAIEQRH
jgi:PAS domain-containing protein